MKVKVTKVFIMAVLDLVNGIDDSIAHHGPYALPLKEQKQVRGMLKRLMARELKNES